MLGSFHGQASGLFNRWWRSETPGEQVGNNQEDIGNSNDNQSSIKFNKESNIYRNQYLTMDNKDYVDDNVWAPEAQATQEDQSWWDWGKNKLVWGKDVVINSASFFMQGLKSLTDFSNDLIRKTYSKINNEYMTREEVFAEAEKTGQEITQKIVREYDAFYGKKSLRTQEPVDYKKYY